MLIIEDKTGIFQYSTQFSVLENDECGSSASSTTTSASKTGPGPVGPTGPAGNGTIINPGKNSTWATASSEEGQTMIPPTTVLPTQAPATGIAGAGTSTTMVWSTATQPTAASTGPSQPTGVSGAGRNAAGALFLGAVGAAFML
jgi:hypothetical protein